MNKEIRESLEKQHYRVVGEHSSVKICNWTKKSLTDKGVCYKEQFYGINSHRCCQMTPCMFCCNRCSYCWRSIDLFSGTEIEGKIDDVDGVIRKGLDAHRKLLNGFPGNLELNKEKFREAQSPKHFAISLIGEPTMYPKINGLIGELHKKRISSFLVTNGQYPERIKNLKQVTQLYLSLDAPDKELLKKLDNPLFSDYWERLMESLENLSKRKERTCIRLTMIKDMNMCDEEGYSELIKKGNPDFVEVKAYMHVGYSRKILEHENMPFSEDVREFSEKLIKFLDGYEIIDEHKDSRVVLLVKKTLKGKTKIDFDKFFKLITSKEIKVEEYLK